MRARMTGRHGYTLIEILVVLVVLAAVLIVSAPSFLGSSTRAQDTQSLARLDGVQKIVKLEATSDLDGVFPASAQLMGALAVDHQNLDIAQGPPSAATNNRQIAVQRQSGDMVALHTVSSSGKHLTMLVPRVGTKSTSTYANAVLSDNPKSYYTFNELLSDQALDAGALDVSAMPGSGVALGAASPFVGADQFGALLTSASGGLQIPARLANLPMTIEMWVNPATVGSEQILFYAGDGGFGNGDSSHDELWLGLTPSGATTKFKAGIRDGDLQASVLAAGSVNAGEWYHVGLVVSPTRMRLYVNGANAGAVNLASAPTLSTLEANTWLGRPQGASRFFTGYLDEFAVYGAALSAQRMKAHHDAAPRP